MDTLHEIDVAEFHEGALTNATAILQKQGKIKGLNIKPQSVQKFL